MDFLGSEVFGQALLILLRQEHWTNDNLLWDVVALLEETYSFYVMGVKSTQQSHMSVAVDDSLASGFQSELPRQV